MTVHVVVGPKEEDDVVLKGTTRFPEINNITINAQVDHGEQGIAEVKYFGGPFEGIRAVKFELPNTATEFKPGRTAIRFTPPGFSASPATVCGSRSARTTSPSSGPCGDSCRSGFPQEFQDAGSVPTTVCSHTLRRT
jgi:hypothetical protein